MSLNQSFISDTFKLLKLFNAWFYIQMNYLG